MGVPVDLPARLADQLSALTLGIVGDQDMLTADLADLVATLTDTVSGYAGLQLTLVHTGHPVHLTARPTSRPPDTAGPRVVSSLRFPLPLISPTFEDGSQLVVWSSVPGSLVDLAADLAYVYRTAIPNPDQADAAKLVLLDADLEPPAAVAGVDGLVELATIHRAAGLLVDQGHDPDTVHVTLRRDAAAAGLSTHAFAARLLRR